MTTRRRDYSPFDGEAAAPTRFAVRCPYHGVVYLTLQEYDWQMGKEDDLWRCPRMDNGPERFGLCHAPSSFQDDIYEGEGEEGEGGA